MILKIMGIINITPDSFYKDSQSNSINKIQLKIDSFIKNKVDIIDIGAESSKPGSYQISKIEELNRLKLIFNIIKNYPDITFSIDTYKSEIAKICLDNGFKIVNDIYAGRRDNNIFSIIKEYNAKIILMHMKGDPINMQNNTEYENIISDINIFFKKRLKEAINNGIKKNKIIIDPGLGFGKSLKDNYLIINKLDSFKVHNVPILIGPSRKSFLSLENDDPQNRLTGTIVSTTIAFQKGAKYIRVHDVEEIKKCIDINNLFLNCN